MNAKTILKLLVVFLLAAIPAAAGDNTYNDNVYSKTTRGWKQAIKEHSLGGTSWLGVMQGNGDVDSKHKNKARATLIYVPATFNRLQPFELVFFFHGLNGFKKLNGRVGNSIIAMEKQDRNFVLVIPEMPWSANTSTTRSRQGYAWSGRRHENLNIFYDCVIETLQSKFYIDPNVRQITMIGHSAGGSALKAAARSGALDQIRPDLIVFSDAGYGTWTDQTWDHFTARSGTRFVLMVREGDTPHRNTVRFLRRFRYQVPGNIRLIVYPRNKWSHTRIGNNSMILSNGF